MRNLAFISRHEPTIEQHQLAKEKGFIIVHVGDRDAFTFDFKELDKSFAGVIVVHPALAIKALQYFSIVGVFENINRAKVGEKPKFVTGALHLFRVGVNVYVRRLNMVSVITSKRTHLPKKDPSLCEECQNAPAKYLNNRLCLRCWNYVQTDPTNSTRNYKRIKKLED